MKVKSLSRVRLLAIPWTAAYQAPPSMGFFQARVLEWLAIAFSEFGVAVAAAAAAKSLQSCPTLCDPIDGGLPGSPVPGILQARTLEWVAISFSNLSAAAAAVTSVVSDSVRPHRRQPTRLPRPWDSPGKNTGVGCHFLLQSSI